LSRLKSPTSLETARGIEIRAEHDSHSKRVDEHIDNDVVYGVKDALIVEFVKRPPGRAPNGEMVETPFYEVQYDFVLEQKQAALEAAE
jgi:hypothetical protein